MHGGIGARRVVAVTQALDPAARVEVEVRGGVTTRVRRGTLALHRARVLQLIDDGGIVGPVPGIVHVVTDVGGLASAAHRRGWRGRTDRNVRAGRRAAARTRLNADGLCGGAEVTADTHLVARAAAERDGARDADADDAGLPKTVSHESPGRAPSGASRWPTRLRELQRGSEVQEHPAAV